MRNLVLVAMLTVTLVGCGTRSHQLGQRSEPPGEDPPRSGECSLLPGEAGVSDPEGGVECVPPIPPPFSLSGQQHFDNGRYREAGTCFVVAYEEARSVSWLYNAGVSYDRAGLTEEAHVVLRRLLDAEPSPRVGPRGSSCDRTPQRVERRLNDRLEALHIIGRSCFPRHT